MEALSLGQSLSDSARAHVAGCPVCGRRDADDGAAEGARALFAAVEAGVRSDGGPAGWLRSRPTTERVLLGAAWAALLVTAVAIEMPRSAFGPVPTARVVLVVTVLSALLALTLRLGLRALHTLPPSRRAVLVTFAAAFAAPFAFALLPAAGPAMAVGGSSGAVRASLGCFVIGAATGALLVVSLWALDRGAHRSRDIVLLAAAGGGLVGNAALELHCPATSPGHLLLGHASIGLVLAAAYLLARRRTFR
jgi:hypothetical protein